MDEIMIQVTGVGKEYQLGQIGGTTLRNELQRFSDKIHGREDSTKKLNALQYQKDERFRALDAVSFTVNKGERIGIIGANGAGKTTLLKLISRITSPTEGSIGINGRVASMLEVGTGFHPELTGRENIYLNGAILGMKRREIDAKLEEIIEFSECRQFIDTPVKRYSSGMYVKLAFSVAAHLDSEILILDEVLAVGDAAFHKKCLKKINDISQNEGRTLLYVSHNMDTIRELCNRVLVLSHGKLIFDGKPEEGIALYLGAGEGILPVQYDFEALPVTHPRYGKEAKLCSLTLLEKEEAVFSRGEPIRFSLSYKTTQPRERLRLTLTVRTADGRLLGMAETAEPLSSPQAEVVNTVALESNLAQLAPGSYTLALTLHADEGDRLPHSLDGTGDVICIEIRESEPQGLRWRSGSFGNISFRPIEVIADTERGK